MVAVDCLVDYKMVSTISTTQKVKSDGAKKAKYEVKILKKLGWKTKYGKGCCSHHAKKKKEWQGNTTSYLTDCLLHLQWPHKARDCPKRENLIALVLGGNKEDPDSDEPLRVNPLQLFNAIRGQLATSKSLMFMQALMKGVCDRPPSY